MLSRMRPHLRAVQSGRPIVTFAANSAFSRDIANVLHPYTNLKKHQQNGPLIIARGEGIRVIDEQGKAYIDGLAGLWCASLGFSGGCTISRHTRWSAKQEELA